MEPNTLNDTLLTEYLLGLLSESERIRVEEAFFRDDTRFDRLLQLEHDLVDDYVSGRLSTTLRAAFEAKLEVSDDWRQKVVFAQALFRKTAAAPSPARQITPKSRTGLRSAFSLFRMPAFAGVAALLALFVVLTWQVLEQRASVKALEAQKENTDNTVNGLQSELANLRSREQELTRQLEAERQARQELEKGGAGRDPNSLLTASASFLLQAGLVRGNNETIRLRVPKAVPSVRLQLDLDTIGDYRAYRVALRTVSGTLVWSGDGLRPRSTGATRSIDINLPSQVLLPGEYEAGLLGSRSGSQFEEVAYYYFRVE